MMADLTSKQAGQNLFAMEAVPGIVEPGNMPLDKFMPPTEMKETPFNKAGALTTGLTYRAPTDSGVYVIPGTVEGKDLSYEEALKRWQSTNEHLGLFDSTAAADEFANSLGQRQSRILQQMDKSNAEVGDIKKQNLYNMSDARKPKGI